MQRDMYACLLVAALALATPPASAQDGEGRESAETTGVLVRLEGGRLVVTLDRPAGITVGTRLGLFRPVSVRHPVTHRMLNDRLPLGTVVIDHIGAALSTAHPVGALADTPRVGDIVVAFDADAPSNIAPPAVTPTAPPPTTPAPAGNAWPTPTPLRLAPAPGRAAPATTAGPASAVTPTPATPTAPPMTNEERELLELLSAGLGRTPDERSQLYQRYVLAHRDAAVSARLRAEIALMQQFVAALQEAADARAAQARQHPGEVRFVAPPQLATSLREGEPAPLVLQLDPESPRGDVALFIRRRGEPTYDRVAMTMQGDGYVRGEVPRRFVQEGGYEYFIEMTPANGGTTPLVGRADEPRFVEVLAPPEGPPGPRDRSRIDLRGEYADVGTRTIAGVERAQRFITVEGDFFQRLGSQWLYGYRVGFGVYDGDALPLAQLNTTAASVHTRVIYGYHELEFAFSDFVHLIGRVQVGVFREGLVAGAQARMRIGAERRTNVLFGGELFGEVGQRAFFAFNFAPTTWLPMMAQAEVFNQSVAAGDPMFRFIAQIGVRATSWFTVSARGSYQLRNIENGGFGGGLAMTFDW